MFNLLCQHVIFLVFRQTNWQLIYITISLYLCQTLFVFYLQIAFLYLDYASYKEPTSLHSQWSSGLSITLSYQSYNKYFK